LEGANNSQSLSQKPLSFTALGFPVFINKIRGIFLSLYKYT